jgi:hypothetical protein
MIQLSAKTVSIVDGEITIDAEAHLGVQVVLDLCRFDPRIASSTLQGR